MTFDPRAVAQALGGNVTAAPLRIVIEATASGRKWTARLGDRVLCVTAWPFVTSARLLLAEGFPANSVIEMWRGPPPVCGRPQAVSGWTMTPSNGATLLGVYDRTHCDAKRFVAKPSPAGEQA